MTVRERKVKQPRKWQLTQRVKDLRRNWNPNDVNYGGEKEIEKAIQDAKGNIKLLQLSPQKGTILDLGLNVGEFAIQASPLFDKVIGYESHPLTFEVANNRIRSLRLREPDLYANIEIHNLAVWRESGLKLFTSTPRNSTGSTAREKKFWKNRQENYYRRVDSVSFQSLLDEHKPSTVKIDIESAEYEILLKVEFNEELEFIFIEFHQPFANLNKTSIFKKCIRNLTKQGFTTIKRIPWKSKDILCTVALKRELTPEFVF